METPNFSEEYEREYPNEVSPSKESIARNLTIAVGVIILTVFVIYLVVSSSIKSSKYKHMDLSSISPTGSVAGASVQGPQNGDSSPATVIKPTKAPATPTASPTTAPTSAPAATSTPTPVPPTATPNPTATPTPTDTPTPTPTETLTPAPTQP